MDLTGWEVAAMEDPAGRRGIWFRVHRPEDPTQPTSLELCGGREGDDNYLYLVPHTELTQGQVGELIDLLRTQNWVRSDALEAEAHKRRGESATIDFLLTELGRSSELNACLHLKIGELHRQITLLLREKGGV